MQMMSPSGSSLPMPPQAQILPPVEFHNTKAGTVARRNSEPGKGKASTRAKSGCWTCRIRRKKCDEMKTPEGFCQTCVRLRLECLGWGSRRPDWMREKNNVIERRERIKEFLANNGMIKGHAGSISRTPAESAPDILNLAFTGNSPPRHPGDHSNGTQIKHNPHSHPHMNGSAMLPPMNDRDRRGPLMDFATYVASDPHQYNQLHATHQYQQQVAAAAHHQAMVAGRHHLDGPMLPPLSMPPHPTTPVENGMRTHHLPPPPDGSGMIHAIDPTLQFLADFGPPSASTTDGTSSQATATTDSTGRPVVSLPTPSQWTNPDPFTEPSSFGRLYNQPIDDYDEVKSPEVATSTDLVLAGSGAVGTQQGQGTFIYTDQETGMTIPAFSHAPLRWVGEMPNAGFVFHYLKEVLPVQYLLADQTSIRQWTYNLAQTSESTRSALCLLAALHKHCMSQMSIQGAPGSTSELDVFYSNTRNALRSNKTITEGDAMASLHVISSFLFAGGRGPWHEYLDIASRWVESVLQDPSYPTPRHALRHASESSRFIIRATFWFDCLAAISQLRSPNFLHIYRELFGTPAAAIISDDSDDPDVSMMDVMGCSASGFLSLAEIAALAHWKEEQHRLGKLSVPRLVERGFEIENRFLRTIHYEPGETGFLGTQMSDPDMLLTPDGVEARRRLVSNVFRASAKIYLHSVISGGFPESPEIADGVAETISYLKKVPGYSDASRVVVRSVVFSVCIAGCMALESQQTFFLEQLQALGQEAEVLGNCSQAKKLMQRVWAKRKQAGGGEVLWRESMFESGPGILLLA